MGKIDMIFVLSRTVISNCFCLLYVLMTFEYGEFDDVVMLCSLLLLSVSDVCLSSFRGKKFRKGIFIILIVIAAALGASINPATFSVMWGVYAVFSLQLLISLVSVFICRLCFNGNELTGKDEMQASIMGHVSFAIIPIMVTLLLLLPDNARLFICLMVAVWSLTYTVFVVSYIKKLSCVH